MRFSLISCFIVSGLLCCTANLAQSQTFCPQIFFKSSDTTVCITLDSLSNLEVYANSDGYPVQLMYNPLAQGRIDRSNYYRGRMLHQSIGWAKLSDNLYRAVFPKIRINDLRTDFDFTSDTIVAVLSNYPIQEANNCVPVARFAINKVLQAVAFLKRDIVLCNGQIQQSIKLESTYTDFYGIVWTSDNASFGIATNGVDSIPAFRVNNTSTVDQVAKISYRPRLRNGMSDVCVNYPNEFFITASKATKPIFQPDTLNLSTCLGYLTPILKPIVRGNVAKISWVQLGNLYMPSIPIEGFDSIPASIATLHRPRTYLGSARFRFQAETPGGCTSDYAEYGITIRPRATMNTVQDFWICNGVKNQVLNFTGKEPGLEFRWTSDNPQFGLPAQGFYNVPAIKLLNPQSKEIQTRIRVSPKFPSRIWVAQGPDAWSTFTGYTYYSGSGYDDPGKETFHFSTGGVQVPHPDGHQIYYTDGISARLQVFCIVPCNQTQGSNPYISLSALPQNLTIDPTGSTLYSINYDSSSIAVINTSRWELVQQEQFSAPINCSAFSEDGNKLYLGVKAQKKIWVLDAHTFATLDTLQLSGEVESILPFSDGSGLSLKFRDSSSVKLWDLKTRQVVASIAVSKSPKQLINAKRTNKLYIYEEAVYPNKVLIVDLKSRKLLKTIATKEYIHTDPARKPLKLSVNPFGDLIYINTIPFSVLNTYQDSITYVPGEVNNAKFFLSDGDCGGEPQQFTLTLGSNQAPPTIDSFPAQRLCAGEKSAPIQLTQGYPGIDFNWVKKYKGASYDLETGKGDIPAIEAPLSDRSIEYLLEFRVNPFFTVEDSVCIIEPFEVNYQIFGKIRSTISLGNFYDRTLTLGQSTSSIFLFKNDPNDFKIRYRWVNDNPSVGIPAEGSGDIPGITNRNNTGLLQVANIAIYAERRNGQEWICPEVIHRYQLRLLPFPIPSVDSLPDLSICSGDTLPSVKFSSSVKETVFRWRRIGDYIGEPSGLGTGAILPFKTVNFGARATTAVFVVRPVAILGTDSLVGPERQFKVTISPRFTLHKIPDQHYCTESINYLSLLPSIAFNWASSKPNIITSVIGQNITVAKNNGDIPESSIFQVSGRYPDQTCTIDTVFFKITVYPQPELPKIKDNTLCVGEIYPGLKPAQTKGFQFQWENSNPAIGLPSNGIDSIPAFVPAAPGKTAISSKIDFRLIVPNANKEVCLNLKSTINLNVVPVPNVKKTNDQTLFNCSEVRVASFGSDWQNTSFVWENDRTDLGLPQAGIGSLPVFISANAGLEAASMHIKVKPFLTGYNRQCFGGADSFRISILPSAILPSLSNVELCANLLSQPIRLESTVPWKKIRWNIDRPIGLPSTGIGDIPGFIPSIFVKGSSARVTYNFEFAEQIIISNTANRTLSWVDPLKQTFVNRFEQDIIPWNMVLHPAGNKVYVSRLRSLIDVVNPLTQTIIATIDVRDYCDFALQMQVSRDGNALYLSSEMCNYLLVVNTASNRIENKIQIDKTIGSFTQSPRGLRLYIVTQDGNELLVINPRTYNTVQRIPIGLNVPITNCQIDPAGDKIYLVSGEKNSIFTINLSNGQVENKRSVPSPNEIIIPTTSNKVYVGSIQNGAYYFDRRTLSESLTYITNSKSIGTFALSPDEKTLYATHPRGNKIFAIASETGNIIDSILLKGTNPYGIVVTPKQACVASSNSFQIDIKTCEQSNPKTSIDKDRLLDIKDRQTSPKDSTTIDTRQLASITDPDLLWVGQNEPNPFDQHTHISFYVPDQTKVKWEVFNLAGQRVLANEGNFVRGQHRLEINAESLRGAGIYFLRIETLMGSVSRKMILIHL